MKIRLADVASVIRSKNSGPYELTFDVIFKDAALYQKVVEAGVINPDMIAALYGIAPDQVISVITFDPALAIKVTIVRPMGSGDVGDRDIYGAQQHAPLMALEFEIN